MLVSLPTPAAALGALEVLRDSSWVAFSMVAENRNSSNNSSSSRRVSNPVVAL